MRKAPRQQWKFPIYPTLTALGADLLEYRTGRSKIRCPFHEDKHPSAAVDWVKQHFRCFGCGVYGDAVDLWETQEGLSRAAARDRAEEISGGRDLQISGSATRAGLSLFE